ncbi:MAG TPA: universal stress protein [Blastocatellia bacterium]|nr:universal stress protein [Blastocatellia bacterium]
MKRILVAYDGSSCADAALDDLRRAGLPEQAIVIVVTIIEGWLPPHQPEAMAQEAFAQDYPDLFDEFRKMAGSATARLHSLLPGWKVSEDVSVGSPSRTIIERAEVWPADLVVVGSNGRSAAGRFFLGSVSQKVLTEAHCSVRIARGHPKKAGAPVRIVVGVDGSPESEVAVATVAERSWPAGSEVRVVSVQDEIASMVRDSVNKTSGEGKDWFDRTLEAAGEKLRSAGLTALSAIRKGDPKRVLVEEAEDWDADSIFVGVRGLGGLERFRLGSVSSAVAARAHCSVEVVRASKGA